MQSSSARSQSHCAIRSWGIDARTGRPIDLGVSVTVYKFFVTFLISHMLMGRDGLAIARGKRNVVTFG